MIDNYDLMKLLERIPTSEAAEKALAGTLMLGCPQTAYNAAKTTHPDDYTDRASQRIITECLRIHDQGWVVDPIGVKASLEDHYPPIPGGWTKPIIDALDMWLIAGAAPHWAHIIRTTAQSRKQVIEGVQIINEALDHVEEDK